MNLFFPMLGIGLVTSVHCVAMCGPLVLTYAVKGADEATGLARLVPHGLYHAARLTSYVVVGLLMGSLGGLLGLGGIRGWVTLAAGVAMVFVGLQMTGRFPALARLIPRTPAFVMRALKRLRSDSRGSSGSRWATPVAFGLVTGLMPCGPLVSAQIAAAGSGSAVGGALAMLGFGLGTMPLMFGFGAVSGILSAPVKRRMMAVSAALVAVLGLVMVDRGLNLVGSPVSASRIVQSLTRPASAAERFERGTDGVVEVPLVVENTEFKPAALEVPAGQPVRLIVDRREDNPCSAQLAVPQAGVLVDLEAFGTTVVDLPPLAEGRYTLTCGMGMMSGEIRAVAGESGFIYGRSGQRSAAARPKTGKDTGYSCACCGGGTQGPSVTGTATVEGSVQRITIDTSTGRYVPDVVVLARGIPAEITFTQASGCLQVVEIPDLGVSADLSAGPVTVSLPALEPGTYGFNCGMRMVFGQIVVK